MLTILAVAMLASLPKALLLDPDGATRELLLGADEAPLRAADALVILGDSRRSLELLGRFRPITDEDQARALRVEVDARAAAGDSKMMEAGLLRLRRHEGWAGHRPARRKAALSIAASRLAARVGLGLFAFSAGILGVGAGRALLTIRRETVVMGVAAALAIAVADAASPRLGGLFGLAGASFATVVHAGVGMADRLMPGPRARLLVATLVLLGAAGAALAMVAHAQIAAVPWELSG